MNYNRLNRTEFSTCSKKGARSRSLSLTFTFETVGLISSNWGRPRTYVLACWTDPAAYVLPLSPNGSYSDVRSRVPLSAGQVEPYCGCTRVLRLDPWLIQGPIPGDILMDTLGWVPGGSISSKLDIEPQLDTQARDLGQEFLVCLTLTLDFGLLSNTDFGLWTLISF